MPPALASPYPNRTRRATPVVENILEPTRVTLRITFIAISIPPLECAAQYLDFQSPPESIVMFSGPAITP